MTYGLILVNAVIFVGELIYTDGFDSCLTGQLFYAYGLVPYGVLHQSQLFYQCSPPGFGAVVNPTAAYSTLFTSMFLHASYLHIFGNMLFLFVFGPNVEALFGRGKYLVVYLASGLAGEAATIATAFWTGSNDLYIPEIGASAAISGVLAAYLLLLPRSRILSIIGYVVIPISAFWFIGGWFVLQVLYQAGGIDTGVAYVAHFGGFALGLVFGAVLRVARGPRDTEYEI